MAPGREKVSHSWLIPEVRKSHLYNLIVNAQTSNINRPNISSTSTTPPAATGQHSGYLSVFHVFNSSAVLQDFHSVEMIINPDLADISSWSCVLDWKITHTTFFSHGITSRWCDVVSLMILSLIISPCCLFLRFFHHQGIIFPFNY